MKQNQLVVLKYHENYADNLTVLAYSKILEMRNGVKCFYENTSSKRETFESFMGNFNVSYEFASSKKVSDIAYQSYFLNRMFLKNKKLFNDCIENNVLFPKHFEISDTNLLSFDIKQMFHFKTVDFVKNFDIFDKISSQNSIGIYISEKDELSEDFKKFFYNATKRLNKYVKSPKLYVFTKIQDFKIDSYIDYEVIDLLDWREEFYFLQSVKHKIIPNLENSYSVNFWASCLNSKDYSYVIYQDKDKTKKNKKSIFTNLISIH